VSTPAPDAREPAAAPPASAAPATVDIAIALLTYNIDDEQSSTGLTERIPCFQGMLSAAQYRPAAEQRVVFGAAEEVRDLIFKETAPDYEQGDARPIYVAKRDVYCPDPAPGRSLEQAREWFTRARAATRRLEERERDRVANNRPAPRGHRPFLPSTSGGPWFDPALRSLANLLVERNENDAPIRSEHFLKWNAKGAADNELVFVTGHPGSTDRDDTVAELETERDVVYPASLQVVKRRLGVLRQYSARGAEEARQANLSPKFFQVLARLT